MKEQERQRLLSLLENGCPFNEDGTATYEVGGIWGDAIDWMDWDTREVVGWKARRPQEGDRLTAKMQSGKTALFEFVSVKYQHDPPDMFFATVKDLGYVEEPDAALAERQG